MARRTGTDAMFGAILALLNVMVGPFLGLSNAVLRPSWNPGHLGAFEDHREATKGSNNQRERPEAGISYKKTLVFLLF